MLKEQFNTTKVATRSDESGLRQMLAGYQARNAAVVPDFQFKPGFLYTQVRAISARINQNFDGWPSAELKKSYKTFLNRPVFVNHQNYDPSKARGKVVAARYLESGDDRYIEVVQEIDAARFPKLAREIREGGLDSVSMGVEAGFTICSYCDNKAIDVPDFCAHVKYHKGSTLPRRNDKTGKVEDVLVYEKCYKLGFFELSYVFDPADETAVVSRVMSASRRTAEEDLEPDELTPFGSPMDVYKPEALNPGIGGGGLPALKSVPKAEVPEVPKFEAKPAVNNMEQVEPAAHATHMYHSYGEETGGHGGGHGSSDGGHGSAPAAPVMPDLSVGLDAGAQIGKASRRRAAAEDEQQAGAGEITLGQIATGQMPTGQMPQASRTARDYRHLDTGTPLPPDDKPGMWDRLLDYDDEFLGDLRKKEKLRKLKDQYKKFPELQTARKIADVRNDLLQATGDEIHTIGEYQGYLDDAEQAGDQGAAAALRESLSDEKDHAHNFNQELQRMESSIRYLAYGETQTPTYTESHEYPVSRLSARTGSEAVPLASGSLRGVLPATAEVGATGKRGATRQASVRAEYPETPGRQQIRASQFGLRRNQVGTRPGTQEGRLAMGAQSRNGADARATDGAWGGSPSQESHQARQPTGESGTLGGLSAFGGSRRGLDRLAGDVSPRRRRRSSEEELIQKLAFGEVNAPEDIDTLRDDEPDDEDFKHYVESPRELRTPDFDKTKRLDRDQEQEGLDNDRRVEDVEDINGPLQGGRMSTRSARRRRRVLVEASTGRRFYAEELPPGADPTAPPMDPSSMAPPGAMAPGMDPGPGMDPSAGPPPGGGDAPPMSDEELIQEAEADLEKAESAGGYEDDEDSEEDAHDPEEGDEDEDEGSDEESDEDSYPEDDGSGGEMPSWLQGAEDDGPPPPPSKEARRNGNRRGLTQKNRREGAPMSLSQRGRVASAGQRRHYAEDGYTDGGPYGDNSQGEQEEVFLSQTPPTESVSAPVPGDGTISNTENNLVAKKLQRRIQQRNAEQRRDLVAWEQITGRRVNAEAVESPDQVNPTVADSASEALTGDSFESLGDAPTETNPRDASVRAFRAFDNWLNQTTGRTASQHGNPNFIRRSAARFCQSSGVSVESLFPTLGIVLREARRNEGRSAMKRRADESLDVAAPQDRIDVEKPVSGDTSAEAQASQFNTNDFGSNAGDNIAEPELSVDSQIWAPGEGQSKSSNRKADGITAVRYAEAYIAAGLAPNTPDEKWKIAGLAQTMRHGTIVDRIRLLDAVNQQRTSSARRTAGISRGGGSGIPRGLGQRQLSAGTARNAANDQSTDSALFFKG